MARRNKPYVPYTQSPPLPVGTPSSTPSPNAPQHPGEDVEEDAAQNAPEEDLGPTLGELFGDQIDDTPLTPTLPGFSMEDAPDEPGPGDQAPMPFPRAEGNDVYQGAASIPHSGLVRASGAQASQRGADEPSGLGPVSGVQKRARPPAPSGPVKWLSRIEVGDAYRFDGAVRNAPDWVDRNWHGYDEGVILNVPDPRDPALVYVCHVGDWIVHQVRLDDDGSILNEELVVYKGDVFERLFRPTVQTVPSTSGVAA